MRSSSLNDHTSPVKFYLILEIKKKIDRERACPKSCGEQVMKLKSFVSVLALAMSFPQCELESSIPIHPCLISFLY